MATMLMMNPTGEVMEVTLQNHDVVTLVQSSDVSLADVDTSAPGQKPAGGMSMIWIVLLMLLVVMMFARPRQDKEGEKFRNALQPEQDVVTSTGIFGKIKSIDEVSVILEVAQNTRIRVDKRYVNPVPVPQPAKPEKKKRSKKDSAKDEKA